MRTEITYITEDGKKFDNQFLAKRHECELTQHKWEFYSERGLQKEQDNSTNMKFCKHCGKQEMVAKISDDVLWN